MGISSGYFPDSIDYTKASAANAALGKKTVVLKEPFKDVKTNQLFSAGTRFVVCDHTRTGYWVYIFDNHKKCIQKGHIPQSLVMVENNQEARHTRISNFVALLKQWSHTSGIIPYVWGGCSYNQSFGGDAFVIMKKKNVCGKEYTFYDRLACKKNPKSGFDCTGVLVRAAQICGLPYFLKNSTTVKKTLQELAPYQCLSEGDLIWIPGHVMVVADKQSNTIIEARAYNHGFGKLQEVALHKVFKDMATFSQLEEAAKKKQQLQRLDKNGTVVQYIGDYKLLNLKSIWG